MIFTESTIKISNNVSKMDSTIVLYRGDKNVEIRFTILQSPFKYSNTVATNVIESTNASYGQLVIKTPNDKPPIFSEVSATKEGTVLFTITKEMIDEIEEVGVYTFQIRLMDENKQSRVTIPPVENGIEIKEPIAIEDDNTTNVVGLAKANYAVATLSDVDTPTFDDNGKYIKTNWNDGDIITNASLNKIEDGIYTTNENVTATKKYVDDGINYNNKQFNNKNAALNMSRHPVSCSTEIYKKPLGDIFPDLLNITYNTVFKESKSFKVNMDNFAKDYPTVKSAYNKLNINLYDENDNSIGNSYGNSINGEGLNIIFINVTESLRFYAYFDKALVDGSDTTMETKNGYMTIQLLIPKGNNKQEFIDKIKNLKLTLSVFRVDFLNLNNETIYTPTTDYNPATKKYVDDIKTGIDGIKADLGTDELTTTAKDLRGAVNELNTQYKDIAKEKMDKNTTDISVSQININNGKITQNYLSDELLQQMAGNTPINAVPSVGSITQAMMVKPYLEGKKGKNLFCPNTTTTGNYVSYTNGELVPSNDYIISDYIPVEANKKITLSGNHQQYALFDVNKKYVAGSINEKDPNTITPTVNGFIRINVNIKEGELNTTQLEIGDKATDYENYYKTYLDNDSIKDRIPKEKLDNNLLIGRESLNLFNKNDIVNGVFVYMDTGEEMSNTDYVSSNHIPVSAGKTYCVRLRGAGSQGAFYDEGKNYISGVNIEYTKNFIAPDNAHYFRFAFPSTDLEGQMLAQADNIMNFEKYGAGYLDPSNIGDDTKKLFLGRKKGILTVAKENGDFDNIQSAIDNAGDNNDNPVTILIYPGVYSKFTVIGGRNISLIGIDKHKCIVRDDYGKYDDPPAEIQVNGLIKNLTFISTHDLDTTTNVDSLRSYAVHCDYEGEGTVEFEDCIMICKQNAAFGSGLHNNATIKLTRCELYSETPTESTMTTNGSLFCHSNTNTSTVNQNLIVKDCIIKSKNSYAVYINEVGSGSTMKTTFINNMIWSDEFKKSNQAIHIDTPKTGISGNITLTEESYGNNIDLLNA